METIDSVEELQDVIDFIGAFNIFVNKYGRWLADYPSFYDKETLVHASDSLVKTRWYLEQVRNHHYTCDTCSRSLVLDTLSKYALRCTCGGVLWLCTYKPPTYSCDTCKERFKCLTENRFDNHPRRESYETNLDNVGNYKIIAEY